MNFSNPIISLEPNSLYISTSQLIAQPGKFHWLLYLTDSDGNATKHHWSSDASSSEYYEAYECLTVHPVTTYSKNHVVNFTFLKLKGFVPPSFETFTEITSGAFPEHLRFGFQTLKQNRQAGLTCRTWLLSVLNHLKYYGYLQRTEDVTWLEHQVTNISVHLENVPGGLETSYVGEL